ncbi:MAG: hypothetical protein ACRDXX_01375, partial [Stackebrandtia sp.]
GGMSADLLGSAPLGGQTAGGLRGDVAPQEDLPLTGSQIEQPVGGELDVSDLDTAGGNLSVGAHHKLVVLYPGEGDVASQEDLPLTSQAIEFPLSTEVDAVSILGAGSADADASQTENLPLSGKEISMPTEVEVEVTEILPNGVLGGGAAEEEQPTSSAAQAPFGGDVVGNGLRSLSLKGVDVNNVDSTLAGAPAVLTVPLP